ncbi:MAG: SGNH/GDSL hydrolase family protein [Caulobacterales bacterium]
MRKIAIKMIAAAFVGLLILALSLAGFVYLESRKPPDSSGEYVALGSSFAAGIGLGTRASGSPLLCLRTDHGYPSELSALLGLKLVNASCSGATVGHVLSGGQAWQGPQLYAVGKAAKLVTLTAGGNDVGYVGDLTRLAYERSGGFAGWIASLGSASSPGARERNFEQLGRDLRATLRQIYDRAPTARIIVVTYPQILPASGTCDAIGLSNVDATVLRSVSDRLAEVTRAAAEAEGVEIVDIAKLSLGHDACSNDPWVNGFRPERGTPFHPNHAGARATAIAIQARLSTP